MNEKYIEEKHSLEYIKELIRSFKIKNIEVNNAKFHHNRSYKSALAILKHGILPVRESNRLGITNYTDEQLRLLADTESHVNGIDSISLSIAGLTDLYKKESEYDPFTHRSVDFLISSDIKACRTTTHYGNEYLHEGIIAPDKIKSVDIRLFKAIDLAKTPEKIKTIIENYNRLRDIALALKNESLNIPFREMTYENLTMDIEKVIEAPKIILK